MMENLDTLTPSFTSAMDSCEAAREKLQNIMDNLAIPENERAKAGAALAKLSSKQGLIESAFEAAREKSGLNPPSESIVDQALTISKALSTTLSKAKRAVTILNAITKASTAFTALASPTGTTEAAAAGAG